MTASAVGTGVAFPAQVDRVGVEQPHEAAHQHVAGAAPYTDDVPVVAGTLHAALGLSPVANGRIVGLDLAEMQGMPGVVAVLTAADIPGANECGPIVADDPVLAELAFGPDGTVEGRVRYVGQPVLVVVARTRDQARAAAALARTAVTIEPEPPVLTAREAHRRGDYVIPPMHMARGDSAAALAAAPHRLTGSLRLGGQEHLYLESQVAYAVPQEDGGMHVLCSTQHPSEMQHAVGGVLGVPVNHVQVTCRRMGGGFGGKESQSAQFACIAALGAWILGVPVKVRPDRDEDVQVTGKRHAVESDWEVGFDDDGRILALSATMLADGGHSADLSGPVMTRALCHVDNAYWLPDVSVDAYCARTNKQSSTAFRGFGGPQGALTIESVIDDIARHLGLDPLVVRRNNFYGVDERNVTPYGMTVPDNVIADLVDRLVEESDYEERRAGVARFNESSPVLKRGIALTPVKFGISFNLSHLNQAGALVHVYTDGTALVNHGGTEMGQGLNTKVAQVVAHELGLPLERVRATATDTQKVPNTSATAASSGADLNGRAAQNAAIRIRDRLVAFAVERYSVAADDVELANGLVRAGDRTMPFAQFVKAAYEARVQLWSDGFYATPGLHWDFERVQGRPFFYFSYGAAVSEVLLDTLTGEHRVLRADLLHDVGASLNPAIDRGQIEGAYVQGVGWLTQEELWWHPETGALATFSPSTYKIPAVHDLPPDLRVSLWESPNTSDTVHRSKAVGEPPLLLSFSAFLALRDAVAALGPPGCLPPLRAPTTPEALLEAIDAVRA
ncbi:MAG: xanthine dehydrogenase molybdopterin binding subunit [Candidatus Nanopelagicales bacterium]